MNNLTAELISKSYDVNPILNKVFISCSKGEIVGVVGRNGAGKSTLLKIIFGVLAADEKFVRVDKKIINSVFDSFGEINYLPQHSFLPKHLKVRKIISIFGNKSFQEKAKENQNIKPLLNKRIKELSGGEIRILEVLMLVHSNSKYTFLDEPFKKLSPILKECVLKDIKKKAKDKGFFIVDHDYKSLSTISTRIVLLSDGVLKNISKESDLEFFKKVLD